MKKFEKELFLDWLSQFKHLSCNTQLLEYISPYNSKSFEKLSSETRVEVRRLMKLYSEFFKIMTKFDTVVIDWLCANAN